LKSVWGFLKDSSVILLPVLAGVFGRILGRIVSESMPTLLGDSQRFSSCVRETVLGGGSFLRCPCPIQVIEDSSGRLCPDAGRMFQDSIYSPAHGPDN